MTSFKRVSTIFTADWAEFVFDLSDGAAPMLLATLQAFAIDLQAYPPFNGLSSSLQAVCIG